MALFRADIASILTVRTFKMLFQIDVFRESGVGKESAASVRRDRISSFKEARAVSSPAKRLFRLIKTGRRNRGINRCKLRNLLANHARSEDSRGQRLFALFLHIRASAHCIVN